MSRKRLDIIPTATSQLVPKLACSGVVLEDIKERRNRLKVQYDKKAPTPFREFTEGKSVGKTAMGQVPRNHCQIRRAKAESADR